MKNKLKIFLAVAITVIFLAGSFEFSNAQAVKKLVIDPLTPIFTVTNALPGDESESAPISVQNNGTEIESVQFEVKVTTDPEELKDYLYLKVKEEGAGGACLWGCQDDESFSTLAGREIVLGNIMPEEILRYNFVILFSENASEKKIQEATMQFDINIGFQGEETVGGFTAETEGDNDNDNDDNNDDGNNNEGNDNNNNSDNTVNNPIIAGVAGFLGLGENLTDEGAVGGAEILNEEGTENGDIYGEETQRQSWPRWIWIFAPIIFVSAILVYAWRN